MEEPRSGRRERRRRKAQTKTEGSQMPGWGFQKPIENSEFSIEPQVGHSFEKLTRRDTYTVNSTNESGVVRMEEGDSAKSECNSRCGSAQSRNLTYSLNKDSSTFSHGTYNVQIPSDSKEIRPVPAPRRWRSKNFEAEKVSSDTDRDITEIDLDDLRLKSPKSDLLSKPSPISDQSLSDGFRRNDSIPPVPKPRKAVKTLTNSEPDSEKSDKTSLYSLPKSHNSKTDDFVELELDKKLGTEENPLKPPESNEIPLVKDLRDEATPAEVNRKSKKQRKFIGDLLERKIIKKKSKSFSSLIKLEKKKIPKISSILKDLKEEEGKPEPEDDKTDFQIDSPHYTESAENGRIYVQRKNGFHVMEKAEVLRNGMETAETDENGGLMEGSTVKTAVLFQRYWSRFMTYFHGILAGIAFSHVATVSALMLHYNYESQGFVAVYSRLSLEIHYVFYFLIVLCIVSCCDRIDVGHMNRQHWDTACKSPSTWTVLAAYVISLILTFVNQKTEARFDAFPNGNETQIWDGQSQSEIQVGLLQWYHSIWARDVLVLMAWLVITLTRFEDLLYSHINNMAKYANVKEEKNRRRKLDLS